MNNNIKEQFSSNEYAFNVNPDNTVTITKYLSNNTILNDNLIIPFQIDSKNVSKIGPSAFSNNNNFTEVTIPSSVITIGESAFSDCNNLKNLYLHKKNGSLTNIETNAFKNTDINVLVIPSSVTSIGDGAFNTKKLISVSFLGNKPTYTTNAFISQMQNDNPGNKIYIYYYDNKTGFDKIDTDKFIYKNNPEFGEPTKNVFGYLRLIFLIILLIILLIYFLKYTTIFSIF
jgi:hypothetical protein